MEIPKKKFNKAVALMNELGEKNQSLMGLDSREEGIFDLLLWLFASGEEPIECEDIN